MVASGAVLVYEHGLDASGNDTWQQSWSVSIPGGGHGGPLTVADMDNDGEPEIGVAGAYRYAAFNANGSLLWSKPTEDYSSHVTGSSVFDFNADGKAEVVYADQKYLRVYNGEDGDVVYEIPNPSSTLMEMPVVVDVDNDGHAEIVLASNNYRYSGTNGLRVFEGRHDNWPDTRKIWNQHSYHIDNIDDDGSVPRYESRSWESHNTYRLNTYPDQRETGGVGVPDLTAGYLRLVDNGLGQPYSVLARIGNAGLDAVAAPVILHLADGTVLDSTGELHLEPGTYLDVQLHGITSFDEKLHVTVDLADTVAECDETNNSIHMPEGAFCGIYNVRNERDYNDGSCPVHNPDNPGHADENGDGYNDECVGTGTRIDRGVSFGSNVRIGRDVEISKHVYLGSNVTAGENTHIDKETEVGSNVGIAADVAIARNVAIGPNINIGERARIDKEVEICRYVEIAADVAISKNVTIGPNVSIGENARIDKKTEIGSYVEISADVAIAYFPSLRRVGTSQVVVYRKDNGFACL